MNFTTEQLLEDIEYLARRAKLANTIRFGESPGYSSCGLAANSLVSIAYGIESLENQHLPDDLASADRCVRAWEELPMHRKPGPAKEAMVLILERRVDFRPIGTMRIALPGQPSQEIPCEPVFEMYGLQFVAHQAWPNEPSASRWTVSEYSTGLAVSFFDRGYDTIEEAAASAMHCLEEAGQEKTIATIAVMDIINFPDQAENQGA